jgi:hypothetical protein
MSDDGFSEFRGITGEGAISVEISPTLVLVKRSRDLRRYPPAPAAINPAAVNDQALVFVHSIASPIKAVFTVTARSIVAQITTQPKHFFKPMDSSIVRPGTIENPDPPCALLSGSGEQTRKSERRG